jgi:S1-C subfamily serine protease
MRSKSIAAAFAAGAAAAALVVVLALVTGLFPIKSQTKTVVRQSTTTVAMQNSTALSPEQIYQKYAQGVVEIIATFTNSGSQGFFGASPTQQALGSGFVVSADGYIITNAHVVSNNGQTVKTVTVVFKRDGSQTQRVTGKVVGADNTSDVALIKVDPGKVSNLDPIPLGDSSKVLVGESVVAIGNPLGYDFSLTSGIVSATNRNLQSPNGSTITDGIQTDAAINEGNSGGPLIDSSGAVIGINEQIASQSGGNQGLGFAVPIDTAIRVMSQLKVTGHVRYAWLGVEGQTVTSDLAKALGLKTTRGVLVAQVVSGSPAAKAGIQGGSSQTTLQGQVYVVGGDILTAIDGKQLTSMTQLSGIIGKHKTGDTVTLDLVRGSSAKTVHVTLGQRPASL